MTEKKNVLVIGGSYFAGRIFVILALQNGWQVTVLNRGRYPVGQLGNVTEFVCDRHDGQKLKKLPFKEEYDAVVDFCAYEEGDICGLIECLPCHFKQYIYISTADVCESSNGVRDENSKLQTLKPSDPVGLYTYKKMLLEKELADIAKKRDIPYTILRPVIIYGPFNYAPRESWYIRHIVRGEAIPHPTDAKGKFQMVYVKDVARAVMLCMEKPEAAGEVYNLSAPEIMTYDSYVELLRGVSDRPVETYPVTVEEVQKRGIPLPFPLLEQENELFRGEKIVRELGFSYGDQKESMRLTFQAFCRVYQ